MDFSTSVLCTEELRSVTSWERDTKGGLRAEQSEVEGGKKGVPH